MKPLLFIVLSILSLNSIFAQFDPPPPPPPPPPLEEETATIVEEMPIFPGCDGIADKTEQLKCSNEKLVTFLGQNVGYPAIAREAGFEGTVYIRFTVEKDGSISNVKVLRDNTPGGGLKEAAIKAIEKMNGMPEKWRPGRHRGQAVRVYITVPIKFKLDDDSDDPPLASESGEYSIETDYIPSKKDKKNIVGTWEAGSLNGTKLPSSASIQMKITKKGGLELWTNGKLAQKGTYKIMPSGNKIEITSNANNEYWGILDISKDVLIIIDKRIGKINLVKVKTKK